VLVPKGQWRTQEFSTGGAYPVFHVLVSCAPNGDTAQLIIAFLKNKSLTLSYRPNTDLSSVGLTNAKQNILKPSSDHRRRFGGQPGYVPPINEKRQYFQQLLPPPMAAIIWFTSPNYLTSLPQCSRPHYLVCASSIFLQPLTPSTTTYMYTQKTICLVSVLRLLTLLSSGFNPIPLLALSPLRHRKRHPNNSH